MLILCKKHRFAIVIQMLPSPNITMEVEQAPHNEPNVIHTYEQKWRCSSQNGSDTTTWDPCAPLCTQYCLIANSSSTKARTAWTHMPTLTKMHVQSLAKSIATFKWSATFAITDMLALWLWPPFPQSGNDTWCTWAGRQAIVKPRKQLLPRERCWTCKAVGIPAYNAQACCGGWRAVPPNTAVIRKVRVEQAIAALRVPIIIGVCTDGVMVVGVCGQRN